MRSARRLRLRSEVPPLPRADRPFRPPRQFARLDRRLLFDRLLERLSPEALVLYVFLSLAADARGASWYGREAISRRTGLSNEAIGRALDRLNALGWVAFAPWRPERPLDGVYQVLDLPERPPELPRGEAAVATLVGQALAATLGTRTQQREAGEGGDGHGRSR